MSKKSLKLKLREYNKDYQLFLDLYETIINDKDFKDKLNILKRIKKRLKIVGIDEIC